MNYKCSIFLNLHQSFSLNLTRQPMQIYYQNRLNYVAAFGSPITARAYASEGYRYGFNGMEKDNENNSGAYDFGARVLDSRLGRWLAMDLDHSENIITTSYNFVNSCVILALDKDGNSQSVYLNQVDIWHNESYSINNGLLIKDYDNFGFNTQNQFEENSDLNSNISNDNPPKKKSKRNLKRECKGNFSNNVADTDQRKRKDLLTITKTKLRVTNRRILNRTVQTNNPSLITFNVSGTNATVTMDAFVQTDQFIILDANGALVFNSGVMAGTTQVVLPRGRYTLIIIPTVQPNSTDVATVNVVETNQTKITKTKKRWAGSIFGFNKKRRVSKNNTGVLWTLEDGRTEGKEKKVNGKVK